MSSQQTMKPQILVAQAGIGTLLKTHKLTVPSHQRDYSWTDDEVTALFRDFARSISDNDPAYFLGTIVAIPKAPGVLEVIDGQQRFATVTILLAEMRRYLKSKSYETDRVIVDDLQTFLTFYDRQNRSEGPKLKLNLADNGFFTDLLTCRTLPKEKDLDRPKRSHLLLLSAFTLASEQIKNILAGYDEKDHGDVLNKWITFIEHSAEVILLQVPSGANCYKMFETLNDRGLETTQADLVKNYLFSEAGNERLSEAEAAWAEMRGSLATLRHQTKEDNTVSFLRHSLMAIEGFLRKDKVLEHVEKHAKGPQGAIAFINTVNSLSVVYCATFFRDHEKWDSYPDAMRNAVQTVNFFDIAPFRPTLLAVAKTFPQKEAVLAFQMFISLGVRLIIAYTTRSGVIEETLAKAAHDAYSGKIKTALELKKEIVSIMPSDEKFRAAFETATVSQPVFARYYLRTLERVAKKEPDPFYVLAEDKEVITLEHVLPERPGRNWPQFSEEEVKEFWRRLGNMALLHKNSKSASGLKGNCDLKSADQATKFAVYKHCPYALTSQIATVPKWTTETICRRQKQLAQFALRAWPL